MLSFSLLSMGLVVLPFTAAQMIYDVTVGGAAGNLTFSPEAIFANPGDQVVFHFQQKNHTVTQSSFANPCGPKEGGFDSGFMPVAANVTDNFPTYTIRVNDTNPVWVYCAQAANTANSHCGKGMVFAVNCPADGSPNSFTNFKNSALAIGSSLAAAASSTAAAPSETASNTWTAAYGSVTVPPAPSGSVVTQPITLQSSSWTTVYTSYPNSPAPTPAALEGQVHKVIVGGTGKLTFDPPRISAQPRDIIMFEFHQKNHTVTQSSFADPCRQLNANGTTGFDSGFLPVADDASSFPTWNVTVNDTAPMWAYCRQKTPASHCGAGMVFAVNSDESSQRSFSAFQALAEQLNGTAAAASASPSATGSTSGAGAVRVGILSAAVAALGAFAIVL
ncbi:hypothetical protein OE88DRAFT_100529 [Heliocybe sulcata]|uniref:Cupredoxin n=1 Tax=Heliocybe sulcata TaxID=5364 RepID=A0A5C3NGX0_9AGAM|nr:hypothetical protein OE88DRAFT_100529 [Heliocybe sulcata]